MHAAALPGTLRHDLAELFDDLLVVFAPDDEVLENHHVQSYSGHFRILLQPG